MMEAEKMNTTSKNLISNIVSKLKPRWSWIPYGILLVAMWLFWASAVSTSAARIASLQTIEPYAFAVQEQLLRNFAETGSFFQTIHRGYDDAWTWSGHRALTFPFVGWLYGFTPSALWLSTIMISFFTVGAVGAGGIARRHFSLGFSDFSSEKRGTLSAWYFAWGGLVYLSMPAVMALALQDYQDLCFAVPCLVWAWWLIETGRWWWVLLGCLLAIAPREETVPMAIAIAVLARPYTTANNTDKNNRVLSGIAGFVARWRERYPWKIHLRNIGIVALLAVGYVWWAQRYFPLQSGGHDMPLENAMGSLGHERIFLEGWVYHTRFYVLVFIPLGLLCWFSPVVASIAVALCVLHMSVPDGHGVDRSWSGHCHHMAPAVAFACVSILIGASRVWRALVWVCRGYTSPANILLLLALYWSGWWWKEWAEYYNIIQSTTVEEPVWVHPAWKLKDIALQRDPNTVLVVNKNTALVASDQLRSYTLDESLSGKERKRGLAAGNCAIADLRRKDIVARILTMDGVEEVASEEVFTLWCWSSSAVDRFAMQEKRFSPVESYTGSYKKGSDIPGTAPRESKLSTQMGTFPVINMKDWRIE